MLKYYLPHLVFFAVFLAALIPVLYYYRKRNPNPRFRPNAGEMTMISVLALAVGGAACYFLGDVFRSDRDFMKEFKAKPNAGSGTSQDAPEPREEKEDKRRGRRE
jgi:hypothetical protein